MTGSASSGGLCRFHDQRLHRRGILAGVELAAWVASERPRLGVHQFSLAGLPELARTELLYALQHRDQAPPPLDPTEVRILLARLGGAASLREADPQVVCESGGTQYNAGTRGLFRSLRRHLDRAWSQYAGADPFAGDVWQVALLDLPVNASRRWPATQGEIDFGVIEPAWLREIVKDWARSTRPYLQRLRETLRACQAASHTLITAGRTDPASLGAGDFTRILDAISTQRRTDGDLYSANHRNLMIYQFCQVIEHGRASGLMSVVPDPFRPASRHRVREDPNEDELGKALPEMVIRQLDASLHLLGPAGRAGAIAAADLQQMHQVIYQILRDTGRRPGEVVSLRAWLRRGDRRPAQPGLRQPQGGADAPPALDHRRHRRDHPGLAAAPRFAARAPGPGPVAVPQPAAARPPVPRAHHAVLRGPGVQGLDRPDRCHRLRAARTRRHSGTVRPVPDHPVRAAPFLRPKAR